MEMDVGRSNLRGWWQLSNTGWAKVNMDGSVSKVNSRAALGGAIIGLYEGWLVGFGMVTGLTDIFQVEARAMIEGLKLAWAHGFQQVVESDNAILVDILQNGLVENNSVAEVRMIHTWVSKNWQVRIRLISRDCNRVVDCMANEARGSLDQLINFFDPPIFAR
ncbi:hypothetical protein Goshw_007018 [Gossypium schwendimanii]|uniref:RNase H type-1 domain-containing protein n=1 Tax=Gossypium schwendimanii TaxID=34291 RepID=A0A7J9LEJ7_GOSSC|nr:hypothetical protein [Gossypium schwendimanii]